MSKKVIRGTIVSKPDYEVVKANIYYVYFSIPDLYDDVITVLDGCASGDGHLIMSADYLQEQVDAYLEEKDDRDVIKMLQKIIKTLDGFDGDVWFYTN